MSERRAVEFINSPQMHPLLTEVGEVLPLCLSEMSERQVGRQAAALVIYTVVLMPFSPFSPQKPPPPQEIPQHGKSTSHKTLDSIGHEK